MVNRKNVPGTPIPQVDEGWWESVLADESRYSHTSAHSQTRPEVRNETKAEEANKILPNWVQVKDLYLRDQIVDLHVTGSNRGGLLVEGDGLYGFVPFSHLIEAGMQADTADREKYMQAYVGRTLKLKVIECVPEDGRIVFSERAAQAEPGKRAELFHSLHSGEHVMGTVTNVTDFGVFVDLGGVEGLIHISELSWGRVAHPNQIVKLGQKIEVQVLDLSPERCRVALSLKRLLSNPWLRMDAEVKVGDILPAVVTSVLSYGAFARLDLGIEGLIHASEMPLTEGMTVKELLQEGQQIQVRVLHADSAHQRMGLSMKLDA